MTELLSKYCIDALEWVMKTNGVFSMAQLGEGLFLKNDPVMLGKVIDHLVRHGSIEAHGNKHGLFTRVDDRPMDLDWQNATIDEYPIWLPLWLDKHVIISHGNIIVCAGEKNSGKSSFGRRIAYENQACVGGSHDLINVLDYESHPAEVRRMNARIDPNQDRWANFKIRRMTKNFHKGIEPNGFNVIDYLKINEDFSLVGRMVGAIHESLKDGIAIVFLQKKRGEMYGRGGEFSLEEPRLGLSMFSHGPCKWARATKVKVPREGSPHLEDMEMDYNLDQRCSFVPKTDWRYMSDKERKGYVEEEMFAAKTEGIKQQNKENVF